MRDCVQLHYRTVLERVLTRMLLKRGTGSRERARGTGNRKMGTEQRIGNEVTEGLGFKFCSHFSFSRSSCLFSVYVTSPF